MEEGSRQENFWQKTSTAVAAAADHAWAK